MPTTAGSIAARLNRLAPTRAHREAAVVAGIGVGAELVLVDTYLG